MATLEKKRNIFSFGDDEDEVDDDEFISSVQPLPSNAVERSAFTAPDFDPDTFLSSRRHLGLERMKAELNTHLKQLKTELVELINRDYQDFINLSTNLKGVDKDIEELKAPLADMEIQVKSVREHFQGVIDSLELQLQSRAQLRDKKSVLKLLLNIHDSVTKVEDLLGINSDLVKHSFESTEHDHVVVVDDNLGKQIERVAIEYNQMQHLVRRGKNLAFVTENEWRITRIKDTMEQKLSKALSAALSQIRLGEVTKATKQSLTECLRTYALIDQTQIAERIIREEFIKPFLNKCITQKAVEGARNYGGSPSASSATSEHPLALMYNKILHFTSTDLKPILDITQKTLKGSNYEILVNSLWLEIVDRINKECKSIFAAGQTDVFHKNYSATVSFISELEGLCNFKRSLLFLRNHPTYAEFMKKWQLLVYFQLRFREIIKDVEQVLNDPISSVAVEANQEISLYGGRVVLKAISKCWSDQIFLYGLSHRFWKLTLQLIKRYNGWALEVINARHANDAKILTLLAHDCINFTKIVKNQTLETMLSKLPTSVQDGPLLKGKDNDVVGADLCLANILFSDSMNEALDQLQHSTVPTINETITHSISASCLQTLKSIKSVTNQYRHSDKPKPTEPSYFIPNIFKPFHTFVGQQHLASLCDQLLDEWAMTVAKTVVSQYIAALDDILSSLTKTEKSKAKNSGQLSDEDKIRLQFLLDVEQIGKELDKLKIVDKDLVNYPTLQALVEPFSSMK
ncbi:conserved oligomeric Golgi complex subunit 2 [Mucor ambiguus]|uniref:Conserved oligomeric Golgi complex subunit 2 n=1 Tax=Mucor ambiguus TaxID=91626 RepID=A0A0C9MWJ3_9FUNG|nr:conserved oligomeric Golgi complex subunit 2 [Mucor ambiguus]